LMGAHCHRLPTNVSLAAIFLFSLVTAYMGLGGLLELLGR